MNRECRRRGIDEIIIHTGQHYDYEMSQIFFDVFDLPKPHYYLGVDNTDNAQFSAEVILRLNDLLREVRPDFVLSYGDVNSTLSAAIAATKNGIPFAHVEAGVRGNDLYNPEEINRRVADVLAEVNYCCTRTDVEALHREDFAPNRIVHSGDIMKDALMYTLEHNKIEVHRGDYMVLTLHRQENVSYQQRLETIIDGIIDSGQRVIFPAHPHTFKRIQENGLLDRIKRSKVELVKPLGYLDFVRLVAGANKVLTDSGGVRREAYLMKKPCVVLIELSWFPEIAQAGWKVLTGPDRGRIAHLINDFEPDTGHPNIFGDGQAHLKIIDDLENRFAD